VFFHDNFPGGFSKRSWDDGKPYCSRISDTSINQLCDFLDSVYRAVNQYWESKLKEEAYTKSTLKYLNIDNMEIRKAHMVWEAVGYETVSVSKAMIKVKLLLGTYI
jgi:hypothetical protein